MHATETREQILEKIKFYLERLPDEALRLAAAFIRGLYRTAVDGQ